MQLAHRTNYRGRYLSARDTDDETSGLDLLWVQVVRQDCGVCCPRFGRSTVWITADDLRAQHDGLWELWFVSATDGYWAGHTFYKFVLAPVGALEDEDVSDWEFLAEGRFRAGLGVLQSVLPRYFAEERSEDGCDVAHCHVGLLLPYAIDTRAD